MIALSEKSVTPFLGSNFGIVQGFLDAVDGKCELGAVSWELVFEVPRVTCCRCSTEQWESAMANARSVFRNLAMVARSVNSFSNFAMSSVCMALMAAALVRKPPNAVTYYFLLLGGVFGLVEDFLDVVDCECDFGVVFEELVFEVAACGSCDLLQVFDVAVVVNDG